MSSTRSLRSLLAGPRRESASGLTVLLLVLAVLSVHFLCSAHLDEQAPRAGHSHAAAMQGSGQVAPPAGALAAEAARAPLGDGSHGCSDHHSATAQCDPVLPSTPETAMAPDPAVLWAASDPAYHALPAWSGVAVAAPSLTALGISRT
ncbi:hypothetical protein [Promicromonospora sp. NPDC023987]|uniref:hypothetical protein n=1 Tax=Promicromonospora sp. NPDC023987 TaxID=3155360 RepID=UPI0033EE6906